MPRLLQHRLDPASRLARLMFAEYGVAIDIEEVKPWTRDPRLLELNPAATVPILVDEGEPPAVGMWAVIHAIEDRYSPSAVAGLFPHPFNGPYTATKHAVVGLSKALRHELAARTDGRVGVTVVCPGRVKTAIIDNLARRPEADKMLAPDVQAMYEATRDSVSAGITADEAGEVIAGAVDNKQFWAFPDGGAIGSMIQLDMDEIVRAAADQAR